MSVPTGLSGSEPSSSLEYIKPVKKIHDGADVDFFLTSMAYKDIIQFMLQLNRAMLPRRVQGDDSSSPQTWSLPGDQSTFSEPVLRLRQLLETLEALIADAPPDPGPRRFGNVSFRTWHTLVQGNVPRLFAQHFSPSVLDANDEIEAYLMGSFGSAQRLDYGTGHELSFLAFLGCLWKLGYFVKAEPGVEERSIVLGIFEPYLKLIRRLITTYNLEPAGSHGVWGLDDNSFLPYIFGSAQLAPAITETDDTPTQGSVTNAPDPASVVKANLVEKEQDTNMYFSAVAFIYAVKKGPFWEHSPMLFDISGIKDGWGKINKGMIKMYNAEVLSKFPVVQHFPFGSLFRWEKDPDAKPVQASTHTASQPLRAPVDANAPTTTRPMGPPSTAAPWANTSRPAAAPKGFVNGITQAPWASRTPAPPPPRGGFNSQVRGLTTRPLPQTRAAPEPREPKG